MKKILITIASIAIGTMVYAQQVNYTITNDDPSNSAGFIMNLDLFQMDFSANLSGSSFNVGVWGNYRVNSKIGVDYTLRKSWLTFAKLDDPDAIGNTDLELGGSLRLMSRNVKKNLRVVLKVENGLNNQAEAITTTTYLMIPGTVQKSTHVRGGFILKRNPFEYDINDDVKFEYGTGYDPMTRSGLYGGISFDRNTNLHIQTDAYGHCMNSAGTRFYLDVLMMPVNSSAIAKRTNNNPLGFRAGWQVFQAYRKADTGKNMGIEGDFQMGLRPYTGFFMTASLGVTILKR